MIITDKVLESAKIAMVATVDLETVITEANERGEGLTAIMAVNATLESIKRHTVDVHDHVKSFCVAYNAYCDAKRDDNHNGVCVWGNILLEDMEKSGIYPFPVHEIKNSINLHNDLAKYEDSL